MPPPSFFPFFFLQDLRASRLIASAQSELLQTKAGAVALQLQAAQVHLLEQNVFTENLIPGVVPPKKELLRLMETTTDGSPFNAYVLEY